jgi:hypothetical protein
MIVHAIMRLSPEPNNGSDSCSPPYSITSSARASKVGGGMSKLRVPLSDASIVQSACLARSLSSPKRALAFFQRCCFEIPDEAWAKPLLPSACRPSDRLMHCEEPLRFFDLGKFGARAEAVEGGNE